MLRVFLVIVLALTPLAGAQTGVSLPRGVKSVAFGTAHRYFGPGKEMCVIVYPLPSAMFAQGVTELTYAVELEPRTVKQASGASGRRFASATALDSLQRVHTGTGGFSQTQIGNTISRSDKKPLAPGRFTNCASSSMARRPMCPSVSDERAGAVFRHGRGQMADGRECRLPSALCHLPSAICHDMY